MVPNEIVLHTPCTYLNRCDICINHLLSSQVSRCVCENLAIALDKVWLNRSPRSLACGWYAMVRRWFIWNDSIRRQLISLWNSFSWFVVMTAGNPISKNNCREQNTDEQTYNNYLEVSWYTLICHTKQSHIHRYMLPYSSKALNITYLTKRLSDILSLFSW